MVFGLLVDVWVYFCEKFFRVIWVFMIWWVVLLLD